ncbi:helix-turn-helix transcriptional regulator [Nonomuraea sp. NPDC050153]|uniref:helix-turn-helix transcriptional regulator n=1 Tax=Nonomuraea sp. NPDC050153 TaxID=3364359 RepID=UPI0037A103B8
MKIQDLNRLAWVRSVAVSGQARKIREDAHLTQDELANVITVSRPTICLWESGKRVPRGAAALRYASVLDMLMRGSGVV